MKMRITTLERGRIQSFPQLVHLVPAHARAPHPRIDFDVKGTVTARRPFEDTARIAERRGQLIPVVLIEPLCARGHEDENGTRDAGRTQFCAFFDRRDAVAPGIELLEGLTN